MDQAMDHDYTHPELQYKDLVSAREISDEIRAQREDIIRPHMPQEVVELCWVCGWNSYHENTSSYGPRIKIFHSRDNIGLWAIGSQWLIRDQPNDVTLGNDYMTQQFLREQPGLTIPLIKEMRMLSNPTDKIHFTLMSRAQGVNLRSIWQTLTPEQKSGYSDQLADIIKQLRRFTAPTAQKVDGSLLDDIIVGVCSRFHPPTCKKIGSTTDNWFENIEDELRVGLARYHETEDPETIQRKFQELKDNFPKGGPYVLTHGDLNLTNIIVNDDKIVAIIDWEVSGYFPWWAERWLSKVRGTDDSDELLDPIWAVVCPEMDEDAFYDQVLSKVADVIEVWYSCVKEHPNSQPRWLRPRFCKCKPYAGDFTSLSMGVQDQHKIVPKERLKSREEADRSWHEFICKLKDLVN